MCRLPTDLPEAIDLCKRGIAVAPGERSALPGYQVLLRLLAKAGDLGEPRALLGEGERAGA